MQAPDSANVRIVTTLGHVDHGKTTLMDTLLAANNIISSRMAGKMRYLDSREDEQERGITMESSAVSLKFQVMEKTADGSRATKTFIVNMIDTPGHVDFSSEVSIASRLCDGALLIVDVVEGVCTQTIAVLRQARYDRLRPVLVINKVDRLITELKLTPLEAYHQMARLIEQVNAVTGSFFASERMEDDLHWREERERRLAAKLDALADEADAPSNEIDEYLEKDDEDIYFAPEKGNVIFASAIDGWGFRVGKFAQMYAQKLGMREANLRRVLWGDFYLDPKSRRVISYKHLRGRSLKPLFVQFVLENIWAIYDAVVLHPNPEKVHKIVTTLDLAISSRDLNSKEPRHLLASVFTQWLSLSTCIIQAAIDVIPAPPVSQTTRLPKILYPDLREKYRPPENKLEEDLYNSRSGPDAYVVAYVSKTFVVSYKDMPELKKKTLSAEEMRTRGQQVPATRQETTETSDTPQEDVENTEGEVVLGFARLYAGTIRVGCTVYAVLPRYNTALGPADPSNAKYVLPADVLGLYIMMGRDLVPVREVRAGNIFAIKGLESKVFRSATLCSPGLLGVGKNPDKEKDCIINLGAVNRAAAPIVRVALEPAVPADMTRLIAGLKLLVQSDPCVETFQQQTGEHVIVTAGELHLERCLKDLRERFAKVDVQASKPIVPFRETAVKALDMASNKVPNKPRGTVQGQSSQQVVSFVIRTRPLPDPILGFILDNLSIIDTFQRKVANMGAHQEETQELDKLDYFGRKPSVNPEHFWETFSEKCREAGGEWEEIVDRTWSFGPQKAGGCILVDARKPKGDSSLRRRLNQSNSTNIDLGIEKIIKEFDNHIETGFQLGTFQGPLCAEPIEGLAYFVEEVDVDEEALRHEMEQHRMSQVAGSLVSSVRDACRSGLLDWSPRLKLAMYSCDIQASTDVLGKVYGVISKRRGRIVAEEMKEGTSFFSVSALLPVVESFGFADDIRTRTSGAASPQLIFSGFELLDLDPFWVPKTEEELEDLGEKADRSNIAKGYMDAVRERKGLFVDRKIVEFAEKQRTLKR